MKLEDALKGIHQLVLETAPLIYFVEKHPDYIDRMRVIFRLIASGQIEGITSTVTLTEVLIHPFKLGNMSLGQTYRNILRHSRNISVIPVSSAVAEIAARLRASYNLKTPDALQAATAIYSGCDALLTNDKTLNRVSELPILILDDLDLTT